MTSEEYYDAATRLFDAGRYAEAADRAGCGLHTFPDDGRLWQLLGTARCNTHDFAAAQDALEHASVLGPLHPLAQLALATCYCRTNKPDLACVIYEHLAETVVSTRLLATVAARLGGLGRYETALHVCRRITDLDPAHHQAHFGVAFYLCRLGYSAEDLVPHLAMAMDLAPDVLHYRINLALAWADAGWHREGYELLAPVPVDTVRCPCWLARMRALFEQAGDHERALACQHQLDNLTT